MGSTTDLNDYLTHVKVTINGVICNIPVTLTYEDLVQLGGQTGQPSVTIIRPDMKPLMPHSGQTITLVQDSYISMYHTNNA